MKLYTSIIRGLSYVQAEEMKHKGLAVSREELDEFYFNRKGIDYALLKCGSLIKNSDKILDINKNDWCLVLPSQHSVEVLKKYDF